MNAVHHAPEALSGIRVLDLSRILAGPWCTQNLADLGAEVIKVEKPTRGDDTRAWGPPWLHNENGEAATDSAYFSFTNRSKKSIAIDIATEKGRDIVRELASKSHVFVENFKVGDMARYGLDYESIRRINPAIVYCSITGYGQTGPCAKKPGYDFIFQALGGVMSVTGEPGQGPMRTGLSIVDLFTGMYATVAVMAALRHAEKTGCGQYLDISLLDSITAVGSNLIANLVVSGEVPRQYGNAHPSICPYQAFETADSHLVVAAGNDTQFRAYCKALGMTTLAQDERFEKGPARIENRDALIAILAPEMKKRTTTDWIRSLEDLNVPCAPINDYRELLNHPQVKHRDLKTSIKRADGTVCPLTRSPLRLSETPVRYKSAPPSLGEHTVEILSGVLGWTPAQIQAESAAIPFAKRDTRETPSTPSTQSGEPL